MGINFLTLNVRHGEKLKMQGHCGFTVNTKKEKKIYDKNSAESMSLV
jgi:hypothetical protein